MKSDPKANSRFVLERFHPAVREWFRSSFEVPTAAQSLGWEAISGGESTLILAPTGSGKTLAAFLWCIDRLMFAPLPEPKERCRVLYISPLKALAVDVERNLRSPIAGISNVAASTGVSFGVPTIAIRTGDTPPAERARFQRHPSDILITTPESLYLLLTSNAHAVLRSIETVIVDEIHAMVPTKRGSHLAISLERLERICHRSPQRIGLSATQHPLEEVARFLGGLELRVSAPQIAGDGAAERPEEELLEALTSEIDHEFAEEDGALRYRPVTIVDTAEKKRLSLLVEMPVEETELTKKDFIPSGPASAGGPGRSIWPAIHPRLLELIRKHRSTLIFVNSRRLAERLAAALNELAGETIVNAHHGSISRGQRVEIEDNLKSGRLPALVATSSLELGIDMGAIDLVIQIEAPPSIASGMQRIGRASHHVGAVSEGVIYPKYRGDLVACAAVAAAMHDGAIEPIRYPRNPLDVLAQQIVAMTAMESWTADELFDTIRCAAPYAELTRTLFDGVLDMLSGVYPSDEFAELRPRITWNRIENRLTARSGAKRIAVSNAGTIPDRGLYGVFLAGAERKAARVGELDEEMVFESRPGETFVLGASTWRIEEITPDRVLVSPAPGEPGKMPFWHGDSAGRTVELGRAVGALVRELTARPPEEARRELQGRHDLDPLAADSLLQYLADQRVATEVVPDDRTVVIELSPDELGDWRVCVLSPAGGRIHAAWAMAATARIRRETGLEIETMWSDDGFILRFPDTEDPPDASLVVPTPEEVESLVIRQLGSSSLFAAKFREIAARALLLPKRSGNRRAPLWQQRKRSADLLSVASRFGSFPMLLETYRECLLDVFDMPALRDLLGQIERRNIRVVAVNTDRPSPFAGSLLFRYVANFLYDGDAPLAERRAQALSIDQSQLRELLGEAELRELLDIDVIDEVERRLQHLDPEFQARNKDALHDLLLSIGDLDAREIAERAKGSDVSGRIDELIHERRALELFIGGEKRFVAVEDASRYRDALGAPLPTGIPERLLRPSANPLGDLISRFARTRGPFTAGEICTRYGLGRRVVESVLHEFVRSGRVVEGEFRPGGTQREWCDANVLRTIRRRSLARLRREVEPVEQRVLARLMTSWQGVGKNRMGLNALFEVIETLQAVPLPASILESDILAVRLKDYSPADLDTLMAAGEVVWVGLEPLGERDGRIAIFLTDTLPLLYRQPANDVPLSDKEVKILEFLRFRGASFFPAILLGTGDGFPNDTLDALWSLVWRGLVTNDTIHSLRSFARPKSRRRSTSAPRFLSRRAAGTPAAGEGRWSLVESLLTTAPQRSEAEKAAALARQLVNRYGVLAREAIASENIPGGYRAVYDVLRLQEEVGKLRRGYFVEQIAAMQFASPGALDLLRSLRHDPAEPEVLRIAATDPANPYGTIIPWPERPGGRGPIRIVGASVILVNGAAACYLARGEKQIVVFLPEDEAEKMRVAEAVAAHLASMVREGRRRALLITEVNGEPVAKHPFGEFLLTRGFVATSSGYQLRSPAAPRGSAP